MTTTYDEFIATKAQGLGGVAIEPTWYPTQLFDFQIALVEWALRKGRAAILADCGLGKSPMQLTWAENVVRHTNRSVLVLTPLAVVPQMLREGAKFGIEVNRVHEKRAGIYVANYERLHHYDTSDFAGVVCDESAVLKSFDGATRAAVTEFMRHTPYRLLCTATPAPNDYIELGTSSEALGSLGFMDMLSRFFKNNRNNSATNPFGRDSGTRMPQWRFRGHAERPFWQWVSSWARCLRRPSDLGFDDALFNLPPLEERGHLVEAEKPREGMLFAMPAVGLREEREERRRTIQERCEKAAALVADTGESAVCWAHLNDEGDLLERLIPGAVQVSGRDDDDAKLEAFEAFASGQARVLVTKPIIGAWGLNWQHCAHTTMFAGHSFEQYYQSIRRFWRFGQKRRVLVEHIVSDGEARVLRNLRRKAEKADQMFEEIVRHMHGEQSMSRGRVFTAQEEVPSWL